MADVRTRRSPALILGMTLVGTIVVAPTSATAHTAERLPYPGVTVRAGMTEERSIGEHMAVTTIGDQREMQSMLPGESVPWIIGVEGTATTPGDIEISVVGTGASIGLTARVQECSERWQGATCPSRARLLHQNVPVHTGGRAIPLTSMSAQETRWFRFDVALPRDGSAPPGEYTEIAVRAVGEQEQAQITPDGVDILPPTGGPPIGLWLAIAALFSGVSVALFARRSPRQRSSTSR